MIRTGIGYDTHKLVQGNNLIVGGVSIPSDFKSVGHSDGDMGILKVNLCGGWGGQARQRWRGDGWVNV